jgi:hypothetical protein
MTLGNCARLVARSRSVILPAQSTLFWEDVTMNLKVGPVQAIDKAGHGGHGFNITDEDSRPLVTFGYPSEAEANAARPLIVKAVIGAIIFVGG